MISSENPGHALLNRLLAGERGELPVQIGLLLERSLALRNDDAHYCQLLSPEVASLRLSQVDAEEIVVAVCESITREPDAYLLLALSFCGAIEAVRTVARILITPPRPLTWIEISHALPLISAHLPSYLAADKNLLSETELARIVTLLEELAAVDLGDLDYESRWAIKQHSAQTLETLREFGLIST